MVRCFLIHTVCPVAALGAADSRVLYSRLFGPDEAVVPEQHRELSPEQRRLLQKEKIAAVARSVCCGASFNMYTARPSGSHTYIPWTVCLAVIIWLSMKEDARGIVYSVVRSLTSKSDS